MYRKHYYSSLGKLITARERNKPKAGGGGDKGKIRQRNDFGIEHGRCGQKSIRDNKYSPKADCGAIQKERISENQTPSNVSLQRVDQ